jgi:hypothetical protein
MGGVTVGSSCREVLCQIIARPQNPEIFGRSLMHLCYKIAHDGSMLTRRKKSIKADETGVTSVGRPLLQYNIEDAVRLVRILF